ncbi:MAG: hypothetical protein JNK85_00860, partial [Verrucomicrobiales bacterium]|nr:hypothetical protein [Verrucomicrobiales bacterium]
GSIVGENGSYVNVGSLRMNGTRVGGNVTFKSDVSIGRDIKAKNLSTVIIGGAEL